MKILVTGASGLLGTEICRQLKHDKKNVVWAMDNHSRSSTIPPCDKFIDVDLTAGDVAYADLPVDFDYIYHYGAINGTKNFYERPNQVLWNNMVGDFNVFEFAGMNKQLKKLVYASSSEVVSDDPVSPVAEHTDITINNIHNARWSYRLPKICAENYLANSNLPYVMIRYFNVYGDNSKAGHFLADQIEKGELASIQTVSLVRRYVEPLITQGADTLVLGCTHYPFVLEQIETVIKSLHKEVSIIDTGAAVAKHLQRLLEQSHLYHPIATKQTPLTAFTTGSHSSLRSAFKVLLGLAPEVSEVSVAPT
jgi:hypothetical protein